MINCRKHDIARLPLQRHSGLSASPATSVALGYQSMIKQWISERMEQELRDRGSK
jgi:hypothetical protein